MVQMTSDPRMPIGMSRCGCFASCAQVDTASNPIKAKNTTDAPPDTPLPPTGLRAPAWCGRKEGQEGDDDGGGNSDDARRRPSAREGHVDPGRRRQSRRYCDPDVVQQTDAI